VKLYDMCVAPGEFAT